MERALVPGVRNAGVTMSESTASPSPTEQLSARHPVRLVWVVTLRTLSKAWDDSIFSKSATAAFWQTLSLPPLLLGVLGSLGFVAGWFGPNTIDIIESKIITFSSTLFSDSVVDGIIEPTVQDILQQGRGEIVSGGFVLSLWAGSSAISTFVDSIVEAHGQQDARNPVWQRIFALLLYVAFLIVAVFVLPLVALGPTYVQALLPDSWFEIGSELIDILYYPAVGLLLIAGLTTLYKVALHTSLPWHRLLGGALLAGVFFMIASAVLRFYLTWVTGTGYTYGALATPIAFLLFTFFLGFAVVLGAEFNATIQEFFPARATRIEQMREWLAAQAAYEESGAVSAVAWRLATGPIRLTGDRSRPKRAGFSQAEPEPHADSPETGPTHPSAQQNGGSERSDQSPFFKPS
ncbi:YihY/virulence factor BrkB family protein [Rhodococcus sp. 15-649-1-2]|nr:MULTISPECIES: YihY/virulence factor BrkB family protein [Rhodococcus]OZC54046.1 YihY/virulence factor BrkB family protein [Rhodococcus sp. 06-621-2]OZC89443.1 YihY/virulence factor BrkB family protein [Rhodococcus sp. 06-418-1B]OZD05621.1 YihY/virulence factor BrkB family protein [Rhodococcus sp. 06-156-4C]OZD16736.1 YihY/virulence factor BrkB family protein [Rhodococcus sp. 06-156-4a]OZD26593.1 YihY/virulence factor BrkB family protein [Rhodococcus sp. 06-156-3C]